jgi:D-alanyl-D-alanine carboxypeptidase
MRSPILVALCALCVSCAAPQAAISQPVSAVAALEQALADAASQAKAGAILDVQGCGLSFRAASGVANRKTKAPMPTDAPLRVASVSKLYTAAIIHALAADGLLDLDKPATHYLTKGELNGVPNAGASLRQMLNHTSGVPDYYDTQSYLGEDWEAPLTAPRALKIAQRRKATGAPGAAYAYSNTGYHILGLVAETVSGKPLGDLIETRLLAPLALTGTRYNTAHPGGAIHGYGRILDPNIDTWKFAENTGADAGITATPADVATYLRALFIGQGELKQIGDAMLSIEVAREKARQTAGFGAEILVSRAGDRLVGHTGDTFGYLTFAFALPADGVTIVGHINANKPDALSALLKSTNAAVKTACAATAK